jgi:hypothetical protein
MLSYVALSLYSNLYSIFNSSVQIALAGSISKEEANVMAALQIDATL